MNNNPEKLQRGFTLIEVLFALFVGLLLMGVVYFSMVSGQRSSAAVESKVVAQQDVRAILEVMAAEIAMASYNPTFQKTGFWRNPNDCKTLAPSAIFPPPNQECRGIQWATPTSLSIEMDLDGNYRIYERDVSPSKQDQNEIISYNYDMNNQLLTREVNCGGATPFLGNTEGKPRSVRVVNDLNQNKWYDPGSDIPVFRYFDYAGNEIPPMNLPRDIPLIRRIDITLAVDTENIDPHTGSRRRMIYTTSVIPRNHGIY